MLVAFFSLATYINYLSEHMCFLKTLKSLEQVSRDYETPSQCSGNSQSCGLQDDTSSFLNKVLQAQKIAQVASSSSMLVQATQKLLSNCQKMLTIEEKVNYSVGMLEEIHSQVDSLPRQSPHCQLATSSSSAPEIKRESPEIEQDSNDPLLEKMFGRRTYRYKMLQIEALPNTIYKERNFNMRVRLVDRFNNQVLNSNIIPLCLGVCDVNGEWVTHNKVGEVIMKGKTETELYHGEGAFMKVYSREVSRAYPEGKFHFVIYPKPSLVRYSNGNSLIEQSINEQAIQPLYIRDIAVKAKKKD